MLKILSIAGSDPSGGAGIQADLKTILAHGAYGMSVITALTAQNTLGVYGIYDIPPEFVKAQLDAVMGDIFPDALKIGMVSNAPIIQVLVENLSKHRPKHIVLDPVMLSTSGSKLLSDAAVHDLIHHLIPMGDLLTPNIPEAEALCSISITTHDHMEKAAQYLYQKFRVPILLKGGHLDKSCDDLLMTDTGPFWISGERLNTTNTHGTGCTLSSAIACQLARGHSLLESVVAAKAYVTQALKSHLDIGAGSGPLDHGCLRPLKNCEFLRRCTKLRASKENLL